MELRNKKSVGVRPFYKILLVAALAGYVVASSYLLTNQIIRLGEMEHQMLHLMGGIHKHGVDQK